MGKEIGALKKILSHQPDLSMRLTVHGFAREVVACFLDSGQ